MWFYNKTRRGTGESVPFGEVARLRGGIAVMADRRPVLVSKNWVMFANGTRISRIRGGFRISDIGDGTRNFRLSVRGAGGSYR